MQVNGGFKKAERGNECCLPLVSFSNVDVVISPSDVEFGEEGGVLHVVNEFGDKG